MISLGAAALTLLAAIPVAILAVRYPSHGRPSWRKRRIWATLSRASSSPSQWSFSAPGMGSAVQTVWMLLFAYLVLLSRKPWERFAPISCSSAPISRTSARTLGYTPWRVLWRVTLPMIWPGVASGGALVFLTVMKELPATLLLSPIGFKTLTTSIWGAVSEAFYAKAAAPALVLILVSSVSLLILLREE